MYVVENRDELLPSDQKYRDCFATETSTKYPSRGGHSSTRAVSKNMQRSCKLKQKRHFLVMEIVENKPTFWILIICEAANLATFTFLIEREVLERVFVSLILWYTDFAGSQDPLLHSALKATGYISNCLRPSLVVCDLLTIDSSQL